MTLASLTELLGPWPDRVPPNPTVLERTACDGYVRERVRYDVERDEQVTAFVLVPLGNSSKAPAIFVHHQHADQFDVGKSEVVGLAGDAGQALGVELARRGYVVLAPDALGFEERNRHRGTVRTCELELARRLLVGQTLLAKALHDVRAGLDYLQTRQDVAPERLGFIGHSYGGRMAIWAAAFDERLVASVSHCGALTYQDHLEGDVPIQPEFVVPQIALRADLGDVARAQRGALLISSTTEDRWSPSAQQVYGIGRDGQGQCSLKLWPGGHVFDKQMREYAYEHLDQHLRPGAA